jgi:hypothetical protein
MTMSSSTSRIDSERRGMRIAFIVGGFPLISETFILNQITGLIDSGVHAGSTCRGPAGAG